MTIPPNLEAFRALMGAVAETLNNKSCFCGSIDEGERLRDLEAQCNALATATPAQLCGIVGTVLEMWAEMRPDLDSIQITVRVPAREAQR